MPADAPDVDAARYAGREVVVAVCGGIAAYKVASVVSALVQRAAGVTVAMTESARQFVGPVTFRALTARPVLTDLFSAEHSDDPQHIRLTRHADLMLVAPATANMIGKVACGICDDLVATILVAAECPVLFAPAMNDAMWRHPAVTANVEKLKSFGYPFVGPAEGWLACRSSGPGRMAEPDDILAAIDDLLSRAVRDHSTSQTSS